MSYRLEEALAFVIHQTDMRLKTEFSRRLKHYELTAEQFGILAKLWRRDGVSQRELADWLVKDRPNVTRLLEKMTKKGLVSKTADPEDRRIQRVYVTEKGRALEPELLDVVMQMRSDAYQGLSDDEQAQLYGLLNRILGNLGAAL